MITYTQTAQGFEDISPVNEFDPLHKLQVMLRQELRLIASVVLKVGAVLLLVEALVWIAAAVEPRVPETVAASARAPQPEKPAQTPAAAGARILR